MDNELIRKETADILAQSEFYPVEVEIGKTELVRKNTKLPVVEIASLGTAFEPLTTAIQNITTGAGGSGLYMVNTFGKEMFPAKGAEGAFRAGLQAANGGVGGGQALLTPLACNPTMLFVAAAMAGINQQIGEIQETQEEILEHLKRKEEAEIIGDIKFLEKISQEYQYNWNNKQFIDANYQQVRDIERESEKEIICFQKEISTNINKKHYIHFYKNANEMLQNTINAFRNYQRAIYMHSYATFLDAILLANFDKDYLSNIGSRLETYSNDYRELYSMASAQIEEYLKGSLEQGVLEVIGDFNENVGDTLAEIPLIKDLPIDELLHNIGSSVLKFKDKKVNHSMEAMLGLQVAHSRPFIQNISMLNKLHNEDNVIYFDSERLYLEA